jgi:tyrosinase
MVGASDPAIAVAGHTTRTRVTFHQPARQAVLDRIAGTRPVNAYLNLENITGSGLHGSYEVYVDVPGAPPGQPPLLAGDLSTFGVRRASRKDGPHGGNGITTVLDISPLIEKLHHERGWDGQHLDVTIVRADAPGVTTPPPPTDLKVGRVSVYYS